MAKKDAEKTTIDIVPMKKGAVDFCILGKTPLICEAVSLKAKQELSLPKKKKTKAEKQTSLKHNPIQEFRDSVYLMPNETAPTLLAANAMWFKAAMTSAAIDVPGATKAELGRLAQVIGYFIPLYGSPKLFTTTVRLSDMARTMDVRTRAILPEWACMIRVEFNTPQLNEKAIANLMAWAGDIRGVGGWRPQKGSGTFGQFTLVNPDHPEFRRIIETQGREVQQQCLDEALPFDLESQKLLDYFKEEAESRELISK